MMSIQPINSQIEHMNDLVSDMVVDKQILNDDSSSAAGIGNPRIGIGVNV